MKKLFSMLAISFLSVALLAQAETISEKTTEAPVEAQTSNAVKKTNENKSIDNATSRHDRRHQSRHKRYRVTETRQQKNVENQAPCEEQKPYCILIRNTDKQDATNEDKNFKRICKQARCIDCEEKHENQKVVRCTDCDKIIKCPRPKQPKQSGPEFNRPEQMPTNREPIPSRRHGGPQFWRAFGNLNEDERKDMMELQANDPEAFREKMQAKADELKAEERQRDQAMENLKQSYKDAQESERPAIKEEIEKMVKENFERRFNEHKKHLEGMKRGVKQFEEQLKERQEKADDAIKNIVERIVNNALNPDKAPTFQRQRQKSE